MKSPLVLLGLLAVLQVTDARYYTPALQCEGGPTVHFEEETVLVTSVEPTTVFSTVDKVHLNTVLVVQPVPDTLADLAASFSDQLQNHFITEVEIVQETHPVTITEVNTAVVSVVETEVEVSTSFATNYATEFETLAAPSTSHVTVTNTGTVFTQLTVTSYTTVITTLTVTSAALQTDVITESVPQTTYVATHTALHTEVSTNVHNLTKMITQFVCPPGLD